jgi:hypothetical protein
MLSVFLAASVFSSSISIEALGIVRESSPFFISEASNGSAKVVALKAYSSGAMQLACRRALTLPQRAEIRAELMALTSQTIPETLSFINANIANYWQEKQEDGLYCEGKVSSADTAYNQAGLALTTAWWAAAYDDIELLRTMLKVALKHDRTQADAVALIASQTDFESGLDYLDKHLRPEKLTLSESKIAVGQIWLKATRFKAVISLMASCSDPSCQQLLAKTEEISQQTDLEQAHDLNSYLYKNNER